MKLGPRHPRIFGLTVCPGQRSSRLFEQHGQDLLTMMGLMFWGFNILQVNACD